MNRQEPFLFIDNVNFYAFDHEKPDFGVGDYMSHRAASLERIKNNRPDFRYAVQIDVSNPAPIVEHVLGTVSSTKIFQAESAVEGYSRQIWTEKNVRDLVHELQDHPLIDEVYFATGLFWDRIAFDETGRVFHAEYIKDHPELKTIWQDGREHGHIELAALIQPDTRLEIQEPVPFWKWLFPRFPQFLADFGFTGFHARDEFIGRAYHNHAKVGFSPDVLLQFAGWAGGAVHDLVVLASEGKLTWPETGERIVGEHWLEWQQFQEDMRYQFA